MSLYNVIFTVLPPLVIGIFDQDVDRETSRLYPGDTALPHSHYSPAARQSDPVAERQMLGSAEDQYYY